MNILQLLAKSLSYHPLRFIASTFRRWFNNWERSDLEFHLFNTGLSSPIIIPAHQVIISTRSEYWRDLIIHLQQQKLQQQQQEQEHIDTRNDKSNSINGREQRPIIIRVEGLRYEIFMLILEYLYTGTLPEQFILNGNQNSQSNNYQPRKNASGADDVLDSLPELALLAEEYIIPDLQQLGLNMIIKHLLGNPDSVPFQTVLMLDELSERVL